MGTVFAKIRGARSVGVLLTPADVFVVYDLGNSLMKWEYKSEMRTKALMKTVLCRERLPHQYPPEAVQGLLLADSMEQAYDILKENEGRQYFILDGNYEHFYFLTNDRKGERLLSLLCSRALTEQLTDILYADLYECDFAGNLECDAADRDGEPVLLSFFCDLPRIKRFDTALQLQNKCGTLICFDSQREALERYCSDRVKFQTIDFEKWERSFLSKKKRLFGILLALPPLLLGLLYGGGYIAQFMRNYHEWEAAGGTPGNGTSPTVPSFAVSECLRAIFTMPYGIVGILICVGALVLLIVMVMRMGYSETGEYDKDRNFIYSKKGTYGTSGFMSEKEAEEIFDLRTSLKNHNGTIFGLLNGRYVCMPEESMLNKNVAVYGASGSMKTRAYCINRILQATVPNKDGKMESLIICDPKSELYEKTSELLRKTHTVKVFNLVCPENSDSWNCLAEIEGDELMAQRFCDVIIKNTGSERGDHFWDSAEMNLLKALVLYVEQGYLPERKNIGQVYRLLTHCDEKS